MSIHLLDEETILKIAAGEVIENPASVVKELVENALDANATSITIETKNGGKSLIRVSDNGVGIPAEELDLAFMRHATSKVESYEDLFSIDTMGFRGEALASIRAVSSVTVLSKREADAVGHFVKFSDPDEPLRQSIAHNTGTTMIVEDLFGKIPVRAGFLKSALAESNRVTDLIYRFAVANPEVSFKYLKDEKIILRTSGTSAQSAIAELFGPDVSEKLMAVNFRYEKLQIRGWIGKTSLYRGNRGMQYTFVNQRVVSEPMLTQIIEQEYSARIPHGRYPIFFIWVEVDPGAIDVNIHPTKQKVQWVEDTIFLPVKDMIRKALNEESDLNLLIEKKEPEPPERVNLYTMTEYKAMKSQKQATPIEHIAEKQLPYVEKREEVRKPAFSNLKTPTVSEQLPIEMPQSIQKEEPKSLFANLRYMGTFSKTYLLFEDPLTSEMVMIDQHAAHERILFESLTTGMDTENIQTQMLLVPQNLRVKAHEKESLMRNRALLESLGFIAEPLGEDHFVIRGIPYQFGRLQSPQALFYSVLDTLEQEHNLSQRDLKELLIKKACTLAVKSGDLLNEVSVDRLIELLSKATQPHTCPHGRPTYIRMPLKSIHKWFQRIPS